MFFEIIFIQYQNNHCTYNLNFFMTYNHARLILLNLLTSLYYRHSYKGRSHRKKVLQKIN